MAVEPVRIYLTENPIGTAEVYVWMCQDKHRHLICTCGTFAEDKDCVHVQDLTAEYRKNGLIAIEFEEDMPSEVLEEMVLHATPSERRTFYIEHSKIRALG